MTTKRLLAIAGLVALFVAYAIANGGSGNTISEQAGQSSGTETTAVLQDADGDLDEDITQERKFSVS